MNGSEIMVIAIVAIVMVAQIVKMGVRRGPPFHDRDESDGPAKAENQRLQQEVQELKERLKVLERITVDKENSLARQIDELRGQ
jgi:uncharacterized protein YlxW (UPF0749 family)